MAKSKGITLVSEKQQAYVAPVLNSDAKMPKADTGSVKKPTKLAQKVLVEGSGELLPVDRKDRQIRSLVGPRTVIGQDDRIRIKSTKAQPWRMICQLSTEWKNGDVSIGTGWLAGPQTVITAGHCIFDPKRGWATSVTVIPALNEQTRPFGKITAKRFGTTQPWINSQAPEFDIAAIHLPKPFSGQLGHFAFAALADEVLEERLVNISGYPGDMGGDQLWHDSNKISKLDRQRMWYQTDTEGGQSGAPAYIFPAGIEQPPVVVGVHAYGTNKFETENSATRLTPPLAGAIRHWTLESMSLSADEASAVAARSNRATQEASSGENQAEQHRLIYIPGESVLTGPELKQRWDETLFGHSIGDRSHLFHYSLEVPDIDVKVSPGEPTMESVTDALKKEVGPGAETLAKDVSEAILNTGDNQLLYGLEQSIRWITLLSRYFLGSSGKKESYRDRIAKQFLENVIKAHTDLRKIHIISHGFGAVVAYDLLTNYRDQFPKQVELVTLATLGSPLGYRPIEEKLATISSALELKLDGGAKRARKGSFKWLDIAIKEDPIASDVDLFPDDKKDHYELIKPADAIAYAGQEEFFAELYLSESETKREIKKRLPPGFSAPVKKFIIASDVADQFSNSKDRIDVLIELNSRIGVNAKSEQDDEFGVLQARANKVVKTVVQVSKKSGANLDDLKIDIMHRYVAAKLLPSELRNFVIEIERQASQKEGDNKDELVVHHVWNNAEMRCLTHRSARAIQVGAARTAYSAYGKGIHWAVLDSGVDSNHAHFAQHQNIAETLEFTEPNYSPKDKNQARGPIKSRKANNDEFKHGTHVAGIIGGQEAPDVDAPGRCGVAPYTRLHCYKVIGSDGGGRESSVIRALEHIYQINAQSHDLVIHGVNLSIGCSFDPAVYACGHSPICKEITRLWNQGVAVCVAAGNAGLVDFDPDGGGHLTLNLALSIGDPANVEEAIAVGSVHATHPHSYGVSYFSSRGPTADGRLKPDCVAPGERISSANAGDNGYRDDSGTSMASPHVSGLIAAFLSVRKEFIGQPNLVKKILLENCTDIKRDHYHQGAGVPNLMKMLSNT